MTDLPRHYRDLATRLRSLAAAVPVPKVVERQQQRLAELLDRVPNAELRQRLSDAFADQERALVEMAKVARDVVSLQQKALATVLADLERAARQRLSGGPADTAGPDGADLASAAAGGTDGAPRAAAGSDRAGGDAGRTAAEPTGPKPAARARHSSAGTAPRTAGTSRSRTTRTAATGGTRRRAAADGGAAAAKTTRPRNRSTPRAGGAAGDPTGPAGSEQPPAE